MLEFFLRIVSRETKRRLGVHFGAPDIHYSLTGLRRFGFQPRHIMDVGAFCGDWTRVCRNVFPDSFITCVEPQESVQNELCALAARDSHIRVVQILLGSESRVDVPFCEVGGGSSLFHRRGTAINRPMTTIDTLIAQGTCAPPELLKIDAQGYELAILDGYTRYLEACQVIQCELSLLPLYPEAPLVHEAVAYLEKKGFLLFDLDEIIRSPSDKAVWQMDALFCRENSFLRTQRTWEKLDFPPQSFPQQVS